MDAERARGGLARSGRRVSPAAIAEPRVRRLAGLERKRSASAGRVRILRKSPVDEGQRTSSLLADYECDNAHHRFV